MSGGEKCRLGESAATATNSVRLGMRRVNADPSLAVRGSESDFGWAVEVLVD